jgi:CheY-like chemotaxis protein
MKLLIVDDRDINLKLLRAQLEAEGHVVVAAPRSRSRSRKVSSWKTQIATLPCSTTSARMA